MTSLKQNEALDPKTAVQLMEKLSSLGPSLDPRLQQPQLQRRSALCTRGVAANAGWSRVTSASDKLLVLSKWYSWLCVKSSCDYKVLYTMHLATGAHKSLCMAQISRNSWNYFSTGSNDGRKKDFFFQISWPCNYPPSPAFLIIHTNHFEILFSYETLEGKKKERRTFLK